MSDAEIEEVRIGRLVQMMAEIKQNYEMQMKVRHAELEWQTRAITHFISSTIEDDKARDQMVKAAGGLSIMPPDRKVLTEDEAADDHFRRTVADTNSERTLEDIMENGDIYAYAKNENKGAFGLT